jgi:hypothetical protein
LEIEITVSTDEFLEAYQHLLISDADIHFLWGGRDSGKSVFIAQKLILDCLKNDYFRCILVKKTYESIKDSQFQTIKDWVYRWGVSDFFEFIESPLTIRCINGNKFIARGCDKPEKLKSISNPSDVWYEEGDHLTEEDYDTISTSLRADDDVKITEWFSFNPEGSSGSFEEHWIDKRFTEDCPYNASIDFSKRIMLGEKEIEIKCTSTHTTYDINPYCTDKRKAKHELLATANPAKWRVYSRGFRGKKAIDRPFMYNFNMDSHVGETTVNDSPLIFSLDFNFDPFVCIVAQEWNNRDGHHLHVHNEIVLSKQGVNDMIRVIKGNYTSLQLSKAIFTGDATQRKRTVEQAIRGTENLHAWLILDDAFKLGRRLRVPRANPKVASTQDICNFALSLHPDIKINNKCNLLINEMQFTECDADGNILKKDRNKLEQRADAIDAYRYLTMYVMPDIAQFPKKYGIKV